ARLPRSAGRSAQFGTTLIFPMLGWTEKHIVSQLLRVSLICACLAIPAGAALADEFYVGEPVVKEGMQFVPNYLTGIEMDRHAPGMAMDPNAIHFEIDIHATKDEKHGFAEDAWIPYLNVNLRLEKVGGVYKDEKRLVPMTAGDGPHYANNFV